MTLVSLKSVKVYIGDANTNDSLTKGSFIQLLFIVSFIQLLFIECVCANTVQSTKNISSHSVYKAPLQTMWPFSANFLL